MRLQLSYRGAVEALCARSTSTDLFVSIGEAGEAGEAGAAHVTASLGPRASFKKKETAKETKPKRKKKVLKENKEKKEKGTQTKERDTNENK